MKDKTKKCKKIIENFVGASIGHPPFEEHTQNKNSLKPRSNLISNLQSLTSYSRGITLIALIITIIIMLILVGVTVSIAINGGLFELTKQAKTDTQDSMYDEQKGAKGKVEIDGALYNSMDDYLEGKEPVSGDWTQDKITVTNGDVTLKVGQAVRGYTGNNLGDGNWYVLGAKNGKLLITTKTAQGVVEIFGKTDWYNLWLKLDNIGEKYKDNNMAERARSIDIDDINNVTGFDPKSDDWYRSKVTYRLDEDGKLYYKGTKYPTESAGTASTFVYPDGSEWITLETGKSKIRTNTYYSYYPNSNGKFKGTEPRIFNLEDSEEAYNLLFKDTYRDPYDGTGGGYWINEECIEAGAGGCTYRVFEVTFEEVNAMPVVRSDGIFWRERSGFRPVVVLKSSVKVNESGKLSL